MEVTYDGLNLGYIRTRSLCDSPVNEGPDRLYIRRTLKVSSILQRLTQSQNGRGPEFDYNVLVEKLGSHRRRLAVTVGGRPFFAAGPLDVANGPVVKALEITRVDGASAFLIDWEVECAVIPPCPDGAVPRADYVSHRWEESVTIDRNFYSIWSRTGKIVTRSDLTTDPDALRGVACPPMTPGMVRESSDYKIQPDGLALVYTIRDREEYLLPPPPATTAKGRYVETSANGAVRKGEVSVELEAPKTADKAILLAVAIQVAIQRLTQAGIRKSKNGRYITASALSEELWENKVSVRVGATLDKLTARYQNLTNGLANWGKPPAGSDPSDGQIPADPGTRGTAGLHLIAAALNDPCLRVVSLRAGGEVPNDPSEVQHVPPATVTITALPTDDQLAIIRTEQEEIGPYEIYKITTQDIVDEWVIQAPVTAPGALPVILQLANPTGTRVVDWTAERVDAPPLLPHPYSFDPNLRLMKQEYHREEPEVESDGVTLRYKATGRFVYAILKTTDVRLFAAGGVPPWFSGAAADAEANRSCSLVSGILDFYEDIGDNEPPPEDHIPL